MKTSEIIARVQTVAPKYDKYLHSKVLRPGNYGVQLTPEAKRAVRGCRDCRRAKPKGFTIRFTEARYGLLQQLKMANGFGSLQELIDYIIARYMEEMENVR